MNIFRWTLKVGGKVRYPPDGAAADDSGAAFRLPVSSQRATGSSAAERNKHRPALRLHPRERRHRGVGGRCRRNLAAGAITAAWSPAVLAQDHHVLIESDASSTSVAPLRWPRARSTPCSMRPRQRR